jgi:hypothetical protein
MGRRFAFLSASLEARGANRLSACIRAGAAGNIILEKRA